jgi:hypothetical protein
MGLEDPINNDPRGLNRIFTSEQRTVAGHGISKESLVRCFLSRPLV